MMLTLVCDHVRSQRILFQRRTFLDDVSYWGGGEGVIFDIHT